MSEPIGQNLTHDHRIEHHLIGYHPECDIGHRGLKLAGIDFLVGETEATAKCQEMVRRGERSLRAR